jgi:hypothetical protein
MPLTIELRREIEAFIQEIILDFATESQRNMLKSADKQGRMFNRWYEAIERRNLALDSFLAKKKVLFENYSGYGLPRPTDLLDNEGKAERKEEPEPQQEIIRDQKWEESRANFFRKFKSKQKQIGAK